MDSTPHKYSDICDEAYRVREKYNLTDTQTLLYNHICRGDYKLRNEDGQLFYDENNNGFGWSGSQEWVKKQFKGLIKEGLVEFKSLKDCRDSRYKSWYFYKPGANLSDLIDASCYVSTWKLSLIKHHLGLKDGFSKSGKYGDLELFYNKKEKYQPYSFKWKGKESKYQWDDDGKVEHTYDFTLDYETFSDMVCDIWSFMQSDGYEELEYIPGTTEDRIFTIEDFESLVD